MKRIFMLTTCSLAASFALAVAGQEDSETNSDDSITEEIVVTADRVPTFNDRRVDEREGAQLISREYTRAQLATTLADALRKTTSVQVDEEAGNQGSIVSIRGLQGDGVSIRVDGAPQNFNQVRHGGANTIWAEPDLYKTITVIPGVASNIYGNGSIGGVVKLETIDPSDLIASDEQSALSVRLGHETNGDALVWTVEGAHQLNDSVSGLVHLLSRDNDSYVDGSGNETLGGATGSTDMNSLVKVSVTPSEGHAVELTHRSSNKEYTARGTQSRGRNVSSTDQFTELNERTVAVQYGFTPTDVDWINANVRYSSIDVNRDRRTSTTDDWTTWGSKTDYVELENTSIIGGDGEFEHHLRYGLDVTVDDLHTAYFDSNGESIMRTRDIVGYYLSDAFNWGPVSVVASVRSDSYRTEDKSSGVDTEASGISPKVQLSVRPFADGNLQWLSVYGLLGTGFRAPSVHETFGRGETGTTCAQGRRGFSCSERVPNPDLDAEISSSWEAGLRFGGEGIFSPSDQLRLSVGYIRNDVEDFIATLRLDPGETVINGRKYSVDRSTFTNINAAEISGWEYSANYSSNRWFCALAAQTMDGEDIATGMNLRDVSPHSTNASVGAYLFEGRMRIGMDLTSRKSKEIDEDPSFNRLAYTVYDLFGAYRFNDRYNVQLRIENATDELYTKRFQSLSIDPSTGEQHDLTYYQPGRNIKLSFEARVF